MASDRDVLEQIVERWRREYVATRNPIVAWNAFRFCRTEQLPIPQWVLEYLDGCANSLKDLTWAVACGDSDACNPKSIAAALGMWEPDQRGGRQNPVTKWHIQNNGLKLAAAVRIFAADGHCLSDACYLVSQEHHVGETTVRRMWDRYREVVEADDLDHLRSQLEGWRRDIRKLAELDEQQLAEVFEEVRERRRSTTAKPRTPTRH